MSTLRKKSNESSRDLKLKKRCIWSEDEDKNLKKIIRNMGTQDWNVASNLLAQKMSNGILLKTPKQCRERWRNKLSPLVKAEPWTVNEEKKLFEMYSQLGPKWSEISNELPGRTDNAIKNFFFCKIRRLLRRIKNLEISDDIRSNSIEIANNLYLIEHILSNYLIYPNNTENKLIHCDKSIKEEIIKYGINKERVEEFKEIFIQNINSQHFNLHNEKGDLIKLKKLPLFFHSPPEITNSSNALKKFMRL